ncbi:gamma subclass chorismate mutase AroQ [Ruegeria arenilitoris]|uniref:gamma subclass chorismate mutase AroQ n=1 Tax=Ruegeria arenilitoris TaxID=1173585 RepID=UPI001479E48B|nr:gamma subclass chorismate mutase AroQ [Ruegeria arenilitoris]
MHHKLRSKPVLALCFLLLGSVQVSADVDVLFGSIHERLTWMKDVAAWKHENAVAVEDLEREAVVLTAAMDAAQELGLSGPSVAAFFQAQIDAAKAIQECWIKQWEAGNATVGKAPDLVTEIRPELLRLGNQVLAALAEEITQNGAIGEPERETFETTVSIECLDDDARSDIFGGLKQVDLAN